MTVELALALNRIGKTRILIVGDSCLDQDIHCQCSRFAQESPGCPVYDVKSIVSRNGGSQAVHEMALALGASTTILDGMRSSIKNRYFIHGKQVARIDENARPLDMLETARVAAVVADEVQRADCVLIADYGKGVCTASVLRAAIDGAKARGIPCLVDPAHGVDWKRYSGATCIKCNQYEWDHHKGKEDVGAFVVVTKGKWGIALWRRVSDFELSSPSSESLLNPPERNAVCVVGAGDMVLASIGVCIAGGMNYHDACKVANAAAGLKVERRGAVPVPRCEVIADLLTGIKIIPSELLAAVSDACRVRGGKVVWTNGCFDGGLHAGHLHMLTEARKQGDLLIVGVNNDESVNYLKGQGRPIRKFAERSAVVAALGCVDYVVQIGSQGDLDYCIKAVQPWRLVLGSDYRAPGKVIVGEEHAVGIHFVERIPGSTSELVKHGQ